MVKSLSAMGLRQEDISNMVGLRSPKTLRKHFRQELSSGMAEANAAVAHVAYEMAVSGRFPAMTFFWEKCQCPTYMAMMSGSPPSGSNRTIIIHTSTTL